MECDAQAACELELVSELGPGDYFGQIALVTGARRNAGVTTRAALRLA